MENDWREGIAPPERLRLTRTELQWLLRVLDATPGPESVARTMPLRGEVERAWTATEVRQDGEFRRGREDMLRGQIAYAQDELRRSPLGPTTP